MKELEFWMIVIITSLGTTIPFALLLRLFRKQSRRQMKEFHVEMRKIKEKYQEIRKEGE